MQKQQRNFIRGRSVSKRSHIEPTVTPQLIRIKLFENSTIVSEQHATSILATANFCAVKMEFIKIFELEHSPSDLSLFYAPSDSNPINWSIVSENEESQTLKDHSFNHDYVITCTPRKHQSGHSSYASCNLQQENSVPNWRKIYPVAGLQNLGNTCFMNSALQCVNHVKSFFDYFLSKEFQSVLDNETTTKENHLTLMRLYSQLIQSFCSSDDGPLIPIEFHKQLESLAPQFFNQYQHDSLEFLNILLDILHEHLMQILKTTETIVSQTFYGQMRTVVICKNCTREVQADESFSFLPLPIPADDRNAKSSQNRAYKLHRCFRTFLEEENIGNNGQWFCEHCNQLTHARKKLFLRRLPPVLILQLKRFNYDLQSYTKKHNLIEYDLDNLDINEYVVASDRDTSIRYSLIAVSNHWGSSLLSGHYVTYAKLPGCEDWYEYNDDRVNKIDKEKHNNNCNACILVYQQDKKYLSMVLQCNNVSDRKFI